VTQKKIILVTGATGAQGGAVVDALQGTGITTRALVRDPASAASIALAARGVELAQGDFDDSDSLRQAAVGAYGVFSVQNPPSPADSESEVRTARKLIEAALACGADVFVHTSVARAGDHHAFAGWDEGRWWKTYWTSKDEANALVRAAAFPHRLILKPAYMMDNFIAPKSAWMYPGLAKRGAIEHAMGRETRLDLIAAADVGRFAAAAFIDPVRFDRMEIDLAAESLTMEQAAQAIAAATGKPVAAHSLSADQAVAMGNAPGLTESQQWASVEGYKVDIAKANAHGIALTKFADWAVNHKDRFNIGPG
jgi:uncharacterized protein YbjT (DUF2867 family)